MTPVIVDLSTKPNTKEVPNNIREQAILTEASKKYKTDGKEFTENFLMEHGIDYTVDFDLSTPDALVVVNNKNGKATISFRGSEKPYKNLEDWNENLEHLMTKNDPTTSKYIKRINELYEKVNEIYDIELLSGFSKGGYGAITLGDKHNVETTTFNPFINLANLRTTKNNKHNIYNTTEDFASLMANPLSIKNPNVKVNTLDPLLEYDSINPDKSHHINNFIKTDARRASHSAHLFNQSIINQRQQKEVKYAQTAKNILDKKGNFTDFIRSIDTADVNIIDNTISEKIQRNGLHHKIWKDIGGNFTDVESFHLTSSPESNYEPVTSVEQRKSFINSKNQKAMFNALQKQQDKIQNEIESHQARRVPLIEIAHKAMLGYEPIHKPDIKNRLKEEANNFRKRVGLSARGIGTGLVSTIVGDELVGNMFEFVPDNEFKEEEKALTFGAGVGAITGAGVAPMAISALTASKVAETTGEMVDNLTKNTKMTDFEKKHAKIIAEGASAGISGSLALKAVNKILSGLGLAAIGTVAAPFTEGVSLLEAPSAAIMVAEGINTMHEINPPKFEDLTSKKQDTAMDFMMNPL